MAIVKAPIQEIVFQSSTGFKWIDVTAPELSDLNALAKNYGLHRNSVRDCLEPFHLPKIENFPDHWFMILRAFDPQCGKEANTMHELTRKIAVFSGSNFLITIHRSENALLNELKKKWNSRILDYSADPRFHLQMDLMKEVFLSFDVPVDQGFDQLQEFEEILEKKELKHRKTKTHLNDFYHFKRRVASMRRVLKLSLDVVRQFMPHLPSSEKHFVQDVVETLEGNFNYLDELNDSIQQTMSLYLSIQSQETNEVIRVLTLFSVFFMPLTLIAGIYGMNFKVMPELEWEWGYFGSLGLMAGVCGLIYVWFKKRTWL